MPQFDQSIIFIEIFWLFLMFVCFYVYLSLYNKVILLRINFFKKWWLFNFLQLSQQLGYNSFISSKCYVENVYLKYLTSPKLKVVLLQTEWSFNNVKQLFLINDRSNFHTFVKKYFNK